MARVDDRIDELISSDQYIYTDQEKETLMLPVFKAQLASHYQANRHVHSWLDKLAVDIETIDSLEDIPLLPTQMFKLFDLQTTEGPLARVLNSSSTTGQTPSRIPISKVTAQRQSKALMSIIKNHFSNKRRPFLVIDCESSNKDTESITARGAAIRGFSLLSRETVYAFDEVDGKMVLNRDRVVDFFERHRDKPTFGLGFTFIIWTEFLTALQKEKLQLNGPQFKLLHGGGWKKLQSQSVSKEEFSNTVGKALGIAPQHILDYYGMVEQTGIVFIDCEAGHKHCPNFAEVLIRNFVTLEKNPPGEPGYIEIMSALPDSYPGMSIITEDVGEVLGIDDCPCGRKGKFFVFRSRIEKSEARGCGDTFRESTA